MVRRPLFAFGILLFLDVAALACSGLHCTSPVRVNPVNIKQLMLEQAASTRGETQIRGALAAPKLAPQKRQLKQVSIREKSSVRKMGARSAALNRSKFKTTGILASPKTSKKMSPEVIAFDAPKMPVAQVAPNERLRTNEQTAPAFDAASEASHSARIVAEAFAEIERKPKGSLEPSDLLAAEERARNGQDPSWLKWIWSTLDLREAN
jgi:hypothetical protein